MAFHTISEELRLGTDHQTLLRSYSFAIDATDETPREEVFALIELADMPANGEAIIKTICSTLKELCFLDQQTDPYDRFETALKEINAVVSEARDSLPNKTLGRINAIVGIISGKDLHLTQAGDAEAYLVRKGTITTITEGLTPDDAVDAFTNIASGKVENHDKLVLASERLLRYATKNEITKIFSPHKDIGLGLEELDEIIVLEGAQTTGVLALDIVTPAVAARSETAPAFGLPTEGIAGDVSRQLERGLAWMRDRLPEGTHIPGTQGLNVDRNYVILGFLVAVILVILSVSWSLSSERNSVKLEEVKTVLASVQENIDVAKLRRNIGDKTTAYERLTEAEQMANDLVKSGLALEEADARIAEIKSIRDELDNIRRFTELTPVADISAKDAAVSLVGLDDFHGRKIAYDAHNLFDITLDEVSDPAVIDAISAIRSGTYFADRDSLVFTTVDGKVIEWRDGALTIADTEDETWKSSVDIGTYASFIYLLDPVNNQIWKYNRKRDSYSGATDYNQNADLTKAVSLTIDGDIWVLANDNDADMSNDIIRIRKGEKQALTIKDLPEDVMDSPSKIYTNENMKFVYVLDQNNGRVLRFYKDPPDAGVDNKQLIYNTQYLFEGMTDLRDFWVDDAEQKMSIITAQGLYEVSI